MFEILQESQGNVLGVRATGKLTKEDYDEVLIPRLEAVAKEEGKVRLLLYLDEGFQGWEPMAMVEDFKVGIGKYRKDVGKLALVGGPEWVKLLIDLDSILPGAEMKTFSGDQLQEAWDWSKS